MNEQTRMITKTIWKYSLPAPGVQLLSMPKGAIPLTVQMQARMPTLWVICDPAQACVQREMAVVGTGWPAPDIGRGVTYCGTVQAPDSLVWHFFLKDEDA